MFKCTPSSTQEIKFNEAPFYASKIVFYNNIIYALSTKGDLYTITNETNFTQLNTKNNIKNFDIKFIKQYNKKLIVIASGYAYLYDLDTEHLSKIDVNINAYEVNDVLLKYQYQIIAYHQYLAFQKNYTPSLRFQQLQWLR